MSARGLGIAFAGLLLLGAELAAQVATDETSPAKSETGLDQAAGPPDKSSREEQLAVDAALGAATTYAGADELELLALLFQELPSRLGEIEWSQEAIDPYPFVRDVSGADMAASSRRWAAWIEEPETMTLPLHELDVWLPLHLIFHAIQEQPKHPAVLRISRLWLRLSEKAARRDALASAAARSAHLLRPWVGDEQLSTWLEPWTRMAGAERSSVGDGSLLFLAGDLEVAAGDPRGALLDFELAEETFVNVGKIDAAALAASKLADASRQLSYRDEETLDAYRRARELYLRAGLPFDAGRRALDLAELFWENRDSVESFSAFDRAIELFGQDDGDSCLLLRARLGRASLLLLNRSQVAAREAEEVRRGILGRRGDPPPDCDICQLFVDEAGAILEDGTPFEGGSRGNTEDAARQLLLEAAACFSLEERMVRQADSLLEAARLDDSSSSRRERRATLEKVLALRTELGDRLGEAVAHFEMSKVEYQEEKQLPHLAAARDIVATLDEPWWAANIELESVREGLLDGEASVLEALGRARRLAESAGAPGLLAEAYELEADRSSQGRPHRAAEPYEQAAVAYQGAGEGWKSLSMWGNAIDLHKRLGDRARAAAAQKRRDEPRRRPARRPKAFEPQGPPADLLPELESSWREAEEAWAELAAFNERETELQQAVTTRQQEVEAALDELRLASAREGLEELRVLMESVRRHRVRRPVMPVFEPPPGLEEEEPAGEELESFEEMSRRMDQDQDFRFARELASLEARLAWFEGDVEAFVASLGAAEGVELDFRTRGLAESFWTPRYRVTLSTLARTELLRRLAPRASKSPELRRALEHVLEAFESLGENAKAKRLEAARLFEREGSREGLAFCDFLEKRDAKNPAATEVRRLHESALAAGLPILALAALEMEKDLRPLDPSDLTGRLESTLRAALDAAVAGPPRRRGSPPGGAMGPGHRALARHLGRAGRAAACGSKTHRPPRLRPRRRHRARGVARPLHHGLGIRRGGPAPRPRQLLEPGAPRR